MTDSVEVAGWRTRHGINELVSPRPGITGGDLDVLYSPPMVLAMFLVAMERQGVTPSQVNGSMTTDVLKDYVARGTWVYPPAHGLRLVGDVLEYCNKEMPRFYPLVIRGPDMRDAGASALQ